MNTGVEERKQIDEQIEEQQLDQQLCFALYAASRAVVRTYAPLLAPEGLTYPQYLTLLVLWENPDVPSSVGELGRRLHLDSGTLTPLLKRLEAMGIVDRQRDTSDERRVLVALTEGGLALRGRLAWVPRHLAQSVGMELADVCRLRDQLTELIGILEAGSTTDRFENRPTA
ncbi:MAG: MarR family winged helix-turn-helix transcriptional regulator [Rhodococcus sp. (in: high G+C Gram-positive bacteria)]